MISRLVPDEDPRAVSLKGTANGHAWFDAVCGSSGRSRPRAPSSRIGARRSVGRQPGVERVPCEVDRTSPRQLVGSALGHDVDAPPVEPPYSAAEPLDFTLISSTNSAARVT